MDHFYSVANRYTDTHVDYQVSVWVSRFETSDSGQAQLSAVWTINNGQNGNELASGQTDASVPVQAGEGGPSAALSQALADMSRQMADRISELNSTQKAGRLINRGKAQIQG